MDNGVVGCLALVGVAVVAESFDAAMAFRQEVREHERRVLEAFTRSEEELEAGHTMPYEAYRQARTAKNGSGDAA